MANCTDAYGTIRVKKVGKEFLEFLEGVQGEKTDAYYKLVEHEDFKNVEVDENGDLDIPFSTMGRWAYSNNIEGYLQGKWLETNEYNPPERMEAYNKFVKALQDKKGVVEIEYSDMDTAMSWRGNGTFTMSGETGVLEFSDTWEERSISIVDYAEEEGYSIYEAIEYLHGDEAADAYDKYVTKCKKEGTKPADADEWYDELYGEE